MKNYILILAVLIQQTVFSQVLATANTQEEEKIPVLIRCDDIGMCHAVNMAAKEVLDKGFPVSMSVMVPCPWFTEAANLLKKYSNVSIGIHLTLNAEWADYRWGPVTGAKAVPSLVDSAGYFFPSRSALFANKPSLLEIENELRAQIKKALAAGLKLDYLDYHMGAAVQTLETRKIVEKLAAEFNLGISRYFEESNVEGQYFAPVNSKLDTMLYKLKTADAKGIKLFVTHVGLESAEMDALIDANPWGPKDMSKHRQAELRAILSPEFSDLLNEPKFRLINYRMLIQEKGLKSMKRPPIN